MLAKTKTEKNVSKLMVNSLYGIRCMNPLHFFQSKFLRDEEKIMKSISKSNFKNISTYKDYNQFEYIKIKKSRISVNNICRCYCIGIK